MEYQKTWERFVKGAHVSQAMPPDDGTVGLALVVLVEDAGIIKRVVEIQRRIDQVVAFAPIPQDSLHITVTVLGEWEGGETDQGKPGQSQVSALGQRISKALSNAGRFQVILKQVNSFFTCPFVEVRDEGIIRKIGEGVEAGLNTLRVWEQDYGGVGYIPHMTLGYYRESSTGTEVQKALSRLRGGEIGLMAVDRMSLVETEWRGGRYRLKCVSEYELK